jgi:hypothetical protein
MLKANRVTRLKFAQWVIVYVHTSGSYLKTTPLLSLCTYFDKNGFSYILGDFFTNSSGHPEGEGKMDWQDRLPLFDSLVPAVKCRLRKLAT